MGGVFGVFFAPFPGEGILDYGAQLFGFLRKE